MAIAFVKPSRLKQYLDHKPMAVEAYCDPGLDVYRAFQLEKATWSQLLTLRVLWDYLGLLFRGRRPQMAREDVHQLGGDFILDRTGQVVYAYRSRNPSDRPSVAELLAELRHLAPPHSVHS